MKLNFSYKGDIKSTVIYACLVSLAVIVLSSTYESSLAAEQIKVVKNLTIKNATTPGLAINSDTNNIYAVFYRSNNGITNLYMLSSADNGSSFTKPVRVNDKEGDAGGYAMNWWSPPIRFGSDNEIFVSWSKVVPAEGPFGNIVDFRLAKSVDNGKTFEPTIYPTKDLPVSEKGYADLAISNNGTILMPYVNNELIIANGSALGYDMNKLDYDTQINLLRSADGGENFHGLTLEKEGCQCCDTATTVGPDGEVFIAYRDSSRDDPRLSDYSDEYIQNYVDPESESYKNSSAIQQGLAQAPIYSTTRDNFIIHTVDNGSGLVYSDPEPVQEIEWYMNGCPSTGPAMEFDTSGILHVGYFTGNGTDGAGYYYVNSADKGHTFGDPVPVYTGEFVPPSHRAIDLAVDNNNNIWMTFITHPQEDNGYDNVGLSDLDESNHIDRFLNVATLDNSGSKVGEISFPIKFENGGISDPKIVPLPEGVIMGFSVNDDFKMITMKI
ncbi:MAG: glycoside hydrolase [Candidatus Nitrosocosmicus sp.]|nr:glycoside hydrolase [Candidatus Nitrosocosmicus sp.]MDN5866708.1 glycoside hydrolase [Candidatus Nitrosocosmicus sp.]